MIKCLYSKERGNCAKCRHCLSNANILIKWWFIKILGYSSKNFSKKVGVVFRIVDNKTLCNKSRSTSMDGKCHEKIFNVKDRNVPIGYLYEEFNGKNSSWGFLKKKYEIQGEGERRKNDHRL